MARLSYECDNSTRPIPGADGASGSVDGSDDGSIRPFPCAPDKYCFYCCCQPQCCFVLQKKTPKHLWEAWYFWLGIALLVVILLSTIGTYVITNFKQNLQFLGSGRNRTSATQDQAQQPAPDEISINILPTSAALTTHRKIVFIAPHPSSTHLTPIVA